MYLLKCILDVNRDMLYIYSIYIQEKKLVVISSYIRFYSSFIIIKNQA
jgi:hypothetical protein